MTPLGMLGVQRSCAFLLNGGTGFRRLSLHNSSNISMFAPVGLPAHSGAGRLELAFALR